MSLLNVLVDGTYSTIKIRNYDKKNKCIQIDVKVYKDSTKTKILTTLSHDLNLHHHNIIEEAILSTPPASPQLGDRYFVGANATGDWAGLENSWMEYKDIPDIGQVWHQLEQQTDFMTSSDGDMHPFWFETLGGYYAVMEEDNSLVECRPAGKKLWDTFFDPALHEVQGENLIKSVYAYLKTLPEYINAVDA